MTGATVLAFLPFAGVLSDLPDAVLGAIVIVAVVKLVRVGEMVRIARRSPPQGIVAWGTAVALDYGDSEAVQDFVNETGIALPVLMGNRDTATDWSVRGFPTYYVIDAEGRIASRSVGYSTWLGMRLRAWRANM